MTPINLQLDDGSFDDGGDFNAFRGNPIELSSLANGGETQQAVGTDLAPGDAAIVQYQRDGVNTWTVVLLEDVAAGTEFSFTDAGWKTDGTFRSNESDGLTFTAGAAISAGTAITFTSTTALFTESGLSAGTLTGDAINLQGSGDQIFMYQGSFDGGSGVVSQDFQFITGYHANGAWNAEADGSQTSSLPAEIADYSVDQSIIGEAQNAVYRGPNSGAREEIWTDLRDQANWYGDNDTTDIAYANGVALLGDFNLNDFNTAPTVTTPTEIQFEVDSSGNTISGFVVGDVDGDSLTVELSLEGTLTLAQTTGLTFLNGDGVEDSIIKFTGSIADINNALNGMTYAPAPGDLDGDAISITVGDGNLDIQPGTFAATIDLSLLDGTDGFVIDGLAQRDQLGYDVSNVGDINGDGIDDIIIGAPYADDGLLTNNGAAYVIYGVDGGINAASFDLSSLDGTNGFKVMSSTDGDELGHSVSAVGDVNGDGFDDFAVGSFNADVGAFNDAGQAWIVFGTGSNQPATVDVDTLDGTNGFSISGANFDDYAGRVVTSAGDVNGDGIDDIIVGADRTDPNTAQQGGSAFVIYGSNTGFNADVPVTSLDGTNGFEIDANVAGERLGRDVSAAGDINGDGVDDIIVGAYKADADGKIEAGKAYVIFGVQDNSQAILNVSTLDGTNGFSFSGLAPGDLTGRSVASAGDINGDGFDDVLISAPMADENGENAGKVYVVFGSAAGFDANIDVADLSGSNGFEIVGEEAYSETGFQVESLGDINGDGVDDILIGSRAGQGGPSQVGSYVVFGNASGFNSQLDLSSLDGTNGFQMADVSYGDRTGFSVSGAGDFNNDGINDLLLGATGADPNGTNSGAVYVVYGNAIVNEAGASDTAIIELEAAPVIADLDGDSVTFTEGDAQALLDAGAALSITDVDSADFDGGVLDIQFASGQIAADGLVIDTTGTVSLSAGQTDGSVVSVGGTAIATLVAGETGGSGEGLQFTLNADATPALVQTLLAAIAYTNSEGDTPTSGDRTLTIDLTDGDGAGADTATVTVSVVAVDDAPTLTVPADDSFAVNSTGNTLTGATVGDVDSADVTVTLTAEGAITLAQTTGITFDAGADGSATMTISGSVANINAAIATLTYVPATDDRDGDTLSITVNDGTTPVTETVAITLTNTAPVANEDAASVGEDGPVMTGDVFADNGNGTDSDANGDTLTVSDVNGLAANVDTQITLASGALLTVNSDGTYSYDANGAFESLQAGQTGSDSFTYSVDDGFTGTDTATVMLTINGANDAPIAQDDGFAQDEGDAALTGDLLADNGNGADGDVDSAVLTISEVEGLAANVDTQITLASGALLTVNADGTFSYDQNGVFSILPLGQTATDTFTYLVDDGNGGTDTATATITINGENEAPVAADDAFTVAENGSIAAGDLLADNGNGTDSDANGDSLTITEVDGQAASVDTQITLASGALLTVNADGTFDYDPNGAFDSLPFGQDATETFTYKISDGNGGEDTATATITINGENEAPVAADDAFTQAESAAALAGDLLADNGNGTDGDDNGDTLTIAEVNGQAASVDTQIMLASGALLTVNADGTFSYDQNGAFEGLQAGQTGTDSFDYTISDSLGGTDTATVNLAINGENDAPVEVVPASLTVQAGSTGNVFTGFAITDADDSSLVVTLAAEGTLTLAQSAGLSFTLGDGVDDSVMAFAGSLADIAAAIATLTYTPVASDRDGDTISIGAFDGSTTTSETATVTFLNTAPEANGDAFILSDNAAPLAGSVFADNGNGEDSDLNGDTLTVTEVEGQSANVDSQITLASGALLTVNSDGTFTYDQDGAFLSLPVGESATDSFTYTVSDGQGGATTATVNLTIAGTEAGDDIIIGTSAGEALNGGIGNDTILGLAGVDLLNGGDDADVIFGGTENDVIRGDAGNDILNGEDGEDRLEGGADADVLYGRAGNDTLIGDSGNDTLFGDGDDDLLNGGSGVDWLYAGSGNDTLYGGVDGDFLLGQDGDDRLFGEDGVDTLNGGANNDYLDGGAGDDQLVGGLGEDSLLGGLGNDNLIGGQDNDILNGGADDDRLDGGLGDDLLVGGSGADRLLGDAGADNLIGGSENDILNGGSGDDRLDGGDGDDTLVGRDDNDLLFGGIGVDQLFGDAGDDILNGQAGTDRLDGGAGDDVLVGGADMDKFVFSASDVGSDTVNDFEVGETIELDGFGYANAAAAASDFVQQGNHVVFTNGGVTITFLNVALADVSVGVVVVGGGNAQSSSAPVGGEESFDFSGLNSNSAEMDDLLEIELGGANDVTNEPMSLFVEDFSADGFIEMGSILGTDDMFDFG